MFNLVVKPHPLAPILLQAINWAQPHDPSQKYPLLGRMNYVWMSKDYTQIKIFVREGRDAWSSNKNEVINQIKRHECFVSIEEANMDKTYVIATFDPIMETHYEREVDVRVLMEKAQELDAHFIREGHPSITDDPESLFQKGLNNMEKGIMTDELKAFGKSFKTVLEQMNTEEKIQEELNKNNITGFNPTSIVIIKKDGTIQNEEYEE